MARLLLIIPQIILFVHAQNSRDTSLIALEMRKQHIYADAQEHNMLLYNGHEYVDFYPTAVGHPFLESRDFQPGTILYDGTTYHQIPLLYDLISGDVIIKNPDGDRIRLLPEKITAFSVLGRNFAAIGEDSLSGVRGFLEVVFDQEIKVLARRWKQIVVSSKPGERSRYVQYDRFFLIMSDEMWEVSRKNVLKAFRDRQDAVRKFMREQKINLRKRPGDVVRIVSHFSTDE